MARMKTVVITGIAGMVGSACARYYAANGWRVYGCDNDMRAHFFGKAASTASVAKELAAEKNISVLPSDITSVFEIQAFFDVVIHECASIDGVIHTAAQPSHDWAAKAPAVDFTVNAVGTMNVLEAARKYCPEAPFIFTSTNKVYGDGPNRIPMRIKGNRYELDLFPAVQEDYPPGIDEAGVNESFSIDQSLHSVFGASKVAADVMVQEYGRYFNMPTACFRGGCLTAGNHKGVALHGFLAYLGKCVKQNLPYTVYGYNGLQVRDNIHATDIASAFMHWTLQPQAAGSVYNLGGERLNSCSVLEAIDLFADIVGREKVKLDIRFEEKARIGDHRWYITDMSKFRKHYPTWQPEFNLRRIMNDILEQA